MKLRFKGLRLRFGSSSFLKISTKINQKKARKLRILETKLKIYETKNGNIAKLMITNFLRA